MSISYILQRRLNALDLQGLRLAGFCSWLTALIHCRLPELLPVGGILMPLGCSQFVQTLKKKDKTAWLFRHSKNKWDFRGPEGV